MKKAGAWITKEFAFILLAASAMLFLKLYLSDFVYGSNDMTYWIRFSKIIEKYGTFRIYSLSSIYNHPPLMSWILKLITLIQHKTVLSFPYLFRMMPIIADFLSALVIWRLLEKNDVKHKVLICFICILNPINFLISGFHGNTDPVFVFFILYTIFLIEENKIRLAGLTYGLSLCIKIVPIILIPVFFYYLRMKKQRGLFFVYALLIPFLVYVPYFFYDDYSVIKNIFFYKSIKGTWGIGHVLKYIYKNVHIVDSIRHTAFDGLKFYSTYFILFFVFIEVSLIKFLSDCKRLNLLELLFLVFSLFLALTPGFGIQYLSWLSFFAILIFPLLGSIYTVLGGVFLYRVYMFWGGGEAPYYANSIPDKHWGGVEAILDIALWLLIVTMLVKFLSDRKVFSVEFLRSFLVRNKE